MSRLHQLPVLTTNLEVEVYLKIHLIWLWLLCSVIKKQSHNWYFKCFLRMWNISISSKPNRPCLNVQQWLVDVVLKIYNIYLLFDFFFFQFIPLITSWRNLFFKISTIWLHWLTSVQWHNLVRSFLCAATAAGDETFLGMRHEFVMRLYHITVV